MTNYINFIRWAKENGAEFSDLTLNTYNNGERGIHANKGLRKGTCVIKIPLNIIIHDGMGEQTRYGLLLQKYAHLFNNFKIIMVIIYILTTNLKDNFFKPYYDILPKNTENFPIFWENNQLLMLKGSNIISEILLRQKIIVRDYENICKIIPEFKKKFSIRDFLWVRTVVGSRNFGIDIDNIHRVAMIPLSDMLNHDPNPDVRWFFDQKDNYFKMIGNRYIKKNVAVTDTYGSKSNLKYLLFYGFTIPDNNNDVIYINIEHGKTNKQLKDSLIPSVKGYLDRNMNTLFFDELLAFFRISVSPKHVLEKEQYLDFYKTPYSIESELLCLKAFGVYLKTVLQNYKYFFSKGNSHNRENIEKFSNTWNAYNLVMGEIAIINFYLKIIDAGEKVLKRQDSNYLNNNYLLSLVN